jgi:glutaredoxin 3
METPTLFVKRGCPYCQEAMEYLDARKIAYQKCDVRGDTAGMEKLAEISSQTKTPTLFWGSAVLADFGTEELEVFLRDRGELSAASEV